MADIDTEQLRVKQPVTGVSRVEVRAKRTIPNQADQKTNVFSSGFLGGLIAALITSTAMVVTNAWVVPTVARHQRRIDRMYQAMFDTAQSEGLLFGYTWNAWYEGQKISGATNKPLEDLQQVEARAEGLANQLPLIFDDQIATDWQRIIDTYQEVLYPITHRREFPKVATEQEINKRINPLTQSAGELVARMRTMIHETENRPWWIILLSGG